MSNSSEYEITPEGESSIERFVDPANDPAYKGAFERPNRNPFKAVWTYIKEVIAELREVIWPTLKELGVSSLVVLAFVIVATALVFGVDYGSGSLVSWVLDAK